MTEKTYTIYVQKVEGDIVLDEEYTLGTVVGENPGTAFVDALRMYISKVPKEARPDSFRMIRDDDLEVIATRWGRTNHNQRMIYYWDLCPKDDEGFLFRIKERNVRRRNAYDIVWDHEHYAPLND